MIRNVLKWGFLGGTGVASLLVANYNLSKPAVDNWEKMEKELGKKPTLVEYPKEMETTGSSKFISSIGDTAYNLFGKQIFRPGNYVNLLEELRPLVSEKDYEEAVKHNELLYQYFDMEKGIPPVAQFVFGSFLLAGMQTRVKVEQEYQKNKEEVDKEKLKPQIIITGLPRTGSTLLHQLLSKDPNCRFLSVWEMSNPVPFPTKESYLTDFRIDQAKEYQEVADLFCKNAVEYYRKCHDNNGSEVEEEIYVLIHTGLLPFFFPTDDAHNEWYFKPDKHGHYGYLKRFLKMSQMAYAPKSHWVLKSPLHGYHFGELLDTFDENRLIVVTHRDPLKVVPSFCQLGLMTSAIGMRDVHNDPRMCKEKYGKDIIKMLTPITNLMMEVRKNLPKETNEAIFDIEFHDLVRDPMAMVEKIYEGAGLELTKEARNEMGKYLAHNAEERKKGKGSHHLPYHYDQFGIEEGDVRTAFKDYRTQRGYE